MDINELKLSLIRKIIDIDDPEQLQVIHNIISQSGDADAIYYQNDVEVVIVSEPNVSEIYEKKFVDPYPLTPEQEERLLQELEEAEEDIKAGRVISHEDMKIYMNSLFNKNVVG